jgi:hypothetical protein
MDPITTRITAAPNPNGDERANRLNTVRDPMPRWGRGSIPDGDEASDRAETITSSFAQVVAICR